MEVKVGKHIIEITNADKIWFPKDKITKLDIVQYYHDIAPAMLPYMKNRPVVMLRYPDGIMGESFYHKDAPDYFPKWIKRVNVKKEGGVVHHVVCNDTATLVYLAAQACLTPHIWLSRIDKINYPDRMILDLDPSEGASFSNIRKTALILQEFYEGLDLHPFVMTTGSRGLHVVVPLKRDGTFEQVHAFAHDMARAMVHFYPKMLTLEMRKANRKGHIFMDFLRNSYSATGVSPYAVRAHSGAPVATPIDWKEVEDSKLSSQRYDYQSVFKRLEKKGDAWEGIDRHAKSLKKPRKKLDALLDSLGLTPSK